jgi:DNA-directed RNA polymerase subunit K/omega
MSSKNTEDTEQVETVDDEAYGSDVDEDDNLDDNVEIDDEDVQLDDLPADPYKNCIYKYAKDPDDDDDDDEEDIIDDEPDSIQPGIKYITGDDRVSKPFMTKYEYVRLIGDRAKQISLGAKANILDSDHLDPIEIAQLEIKHGVIPLIIERPMPNGVIERWRVDELKIKS